MALPALQRFLRLAIPDADGRARITARRIYIIPTGYGLTYGLLLLLMLAGSINYANNLGFLLCFLLSGLGLTTMIHTWRNLLGLELQHRRAPPVFAGEHACYEILLSDPQSRARPGLQLGPKGAEPEGVDLNPAEHTALQVCLPTRRRGWTALPRLTLSTRYPLGLLRAWVYVDLPARCLVYPSPGNRTAASEEPEYTPSRQGDRGVGADDFIGLRHYRPGDSPRHVNWKAVAREQPPQTKLFGGDRSDRRWLDWDRLQGDTETRLSRLCRGVLDACEQQQEFGLRLPGNRIEPDRGQTHRQACLSALALFGNPQ